MPSFLAARKRLAAIPNLSVREQAPLSEYTRFGLGGPAAILCDTTHEPAFIAALEIVATLDRPHLVLGGGTNLVVSDSGYEGIVIRYTGNFIEQHDSSLRVASGAVLQDVVDCSIELGLKGLETMTGIPGFLGGAVYGNAGAYGRSIQEIATSVRVFDGHRIAAFNNARCHFEYRESIFKKRKDWIILSADLQFQPGDPAPLHQAAAEIRSLRDAKYPPTMKCAGSIFKNLLLAHLPPVVAALVPLKVIREGKVPSAWFLEQVGAKGLRRGDIQIASYHANLIYNDGMGTASDLVSLIQEVKTRVRERFHLELEEEVQYVGFEFANVAS